MRRMLSLTAMLVIGTCFAAAQPGKTTYEQLFRPQESAMYHVPIGLCEDYPEESTTLEIIRADMAMLKRTGIDVLRVSFGWDGIETAKGKYNWGFWDDFVRIAAEENGITLVPYICYTPAWNSTGDTTNYWNHTPRDYDTFGPFVEALVNRYKKQIRTWELWNEPDIKEYWSGDAADLARLTKIGAVAVKKADPTAKVVLAGLAGHTEFTLRLFRDLGISPYVDVVNCHSYYETWHGDPLETVVPYVQTLSDIIAKYGNRQSLWMAEVGYSTVRQGHGKISDSYTATYAYEHTLPYQAVALWRTLALLLSTEKMAAITWYEIKDLPAGENVIGDNNNRNLGVDFVGHRAKPAEKALAFFNTFFGQPSACIDRETGVGRTIGSESEVHAFRMEDGSLAVVAWLKTHIRGKVIASSEGVLVDKRSETIDLSLPMKRVGKAVQYDELGNGRPFAGVRGTKGKAEIKGLALTGGTVTIIKFTP
jgi:polysaccharide biosynthesis protein PslG